MHTTNRMMTTPAGTHSQGLSVSTLRDSAPSRILPREGVGFHAMPRKDRAASSKMDRANTLVANTSTGATVLGRISENRM